MYTKEIIEKILNRLIEEPVFAEFKIRKRDSCLIKKSSDGFEQISIERYYQSIDPRNKELALCIIPQFTRRFDILSKWFEKYSFKDIRIQRDNGQVFHEIQAAREYLFYYTGVYFEEQYKLFRDKVVDKARIFFTEYSTLEGLYRIEVLPLIHKEKEMRTLGADWIFEYAKLTWIVDRSNYYILKELLLKNIDFMMFGYERSEPNIARYYDRLDEIFSSIEQ